MEKLDPSGYNWVMLQRRFLIAVRQKKVIGHIDGASQPGPATFVVAAGTETVSPWRDKEDLAIYLLSQELLDSIFAKYMRRKTVAEMWSEIVKEFSHKSTMMRSHFYTEFMAMRYEKTSTSLRRV